MFEIKFAEKDDLKLIAKLSKCFEEEQCCNGIKADSEDFFIDKKVAIVKIDNEVVGYCYGLVEIKNRNTSLFKKGQKSFYIEEIYINQNYRNKNIGKALFEFIEQYAKSLNCEILETTAVSKDYEKLLNFYINKMNMQFWSANLIKQI